MEILLGAACPMYPVYNTRHYQAFIAFGGQGMVIHHESGVRRFIVPCLG